MATRRTRRRARVFALAVLLAAMAWMSALPRGASAATVIFVKSNAIAGLNNGTSWTNAYLSLRSALNASSGGGLYEIWVAAGTYRPAGLPATVNDTFQLHNNVALYGGFAGTETQRSQRNWQTNVTILDGYYLSIGNPGHVYHVVTGSGTNATAVLDGFTVTGGSAGAMYNDNGSPTLTNVVFTGNSSQAHGGAMFNSDSSPALANVAFTGNSALAGGGMFNVQSSPTLTNVTFTGNTATVVGGGAMYNSNGANPTLVNVTFTGNTVASGIGGAIYNGTYSNATLTDVTFSDNSSTLEAGAIYIDNFANLTLTNVTFTGNSSQGFGGAMSVHPSSNPTLVNVAFTGNSAHTAGAFYTGGAASATLTNVTFSGNSATLDGGGIAFVGCVNVTLTNVTFSGNSAPQGGAIRNDLCNASLTNVTFSGNFAQNGGAMYIESNSYPTLTNVSFSGNYASNLGGALYNDTSNPTIVNSILWANTDASGPQMYNTSSIPTVQYSDIQGGYPGTGNFGLNPKFIRTPSSGPDSTWGTGDDDYGDLHLGHGSPAIDAGSNAAVPGGVTTDRDGHPRIMGTKVDMGAYEAFLKLFLPLTRK